MQNDPGDQARQLAGLFLSMADAVDDYRTAHFDELTEQQRALLENTERRLADVHDRLIALAIQGTLGALAGDLTRITAVTDKAKKSIRSLKRYEEIVKIASAAIEVGTAALTGDAGTIASSVEDLAALLQSSVSRASGVSEK